MSCGVPHSSQSGERRGAQDPPLRSMRGGSGQRLWARCDCLPIGCVASRHTAASDDPDNRAFIPCAYKGVPDANRHTETLGHTDTQIQCRQRRGGLLIRASRRSVPGGRDTSFMTAFAKRFHESAGGTTRLERRRTYCCTTLERPRQHTLLHLFPASSQEAIGGRVLQEFSNINTV